MQRTRDRLLLFGALAALLLTGASGAAAPPGFPSPQPGKTVVGVQTADKNPASLSFTVPLYLTVAATEDNAGNPQVIVPDDYVLRNTTGTISGGTYPNIAVTGVDVQGVPGGSWSLTATPAQAKDICLAIGDLVLPDLPVGQHTPVAAEITASDNSFYDLNKGEFHPIYGGPSGMGMNLPVIGALWEGYTATEEQAAAQFRVTYTVSLLDESGLPVGVYYDGPTLDDAATPATP